METGTILRFKRDIENSGIKKGDKAIYLGDSKIRMTTGADSDFVYSLLISAPIEELGCPEKTPFCANCTNRLHECTRGELFEPEILDGQFLFCRAFNFFNKDVYHYE